MKNHVDKIVELLRNPDEAWNISEFWAENYRTGIKISLGVFPMLTMNLYPNTMDLSFFNKIRIWSALKVARKNYWDRIQHPYTPPPQQ